MRKGEVLTCDVETTSGWPSLLLAQSNLQQCVANHLAELPNVRPTMLKIIETRRFVFSIFIEGESSDFIARLFAWNDIPAPGESTFRGDLPSN
jgi:hypothetical protein